MMKVIRWIRMEKKQQTIQSNMETKWGQLKQLHHTASSGWKQFGVFREYQNMII